MIIPVRFHILTVLFFVQIMSALGQSTSSSDANCENQIRVINQSSCQLAIHLKTFSSEVSEEFIGLLQSGEERMIISKEDYVFVYAVNDLNQQVAGALSRNCEVRELAIASCFVDQQSDNTVVCDPLNLGIRKNNRQIPIANNQETVSCGDEVVLFYPDADGIAVWTNTLGESEITFTTHRYEISSSVDESYRGEYTVDWYDANGCSLQTDINIDVANCCELRNEMITDSVLCDGDSLLLSPRLIGRNICTKDLKGFADELFDFRGNVEDLDNFAGAPDSYGPSLFKFNTNEQTYVILKLNEVVAANTEICVYARLGQCNNGNSSDFKISAGLRPFSLDDDVTFRGRELSTDYTTFCLTTSQRAEYVKIEDLGNNCGIRFDAIEWNRQDYFDNNVYEWNTGATTPSIVVDEPGRYTLKMIDCKGCSTYNEVLIGRRSCEEEPIEPEPEPCNEAFSIPSLVPDNFDMCYGETRLDGNVALNDFDRDSFNLVWEIAQRPKNGFVTIQKDGTFFYIPDQGFAGDDEFFYTACKEDFNPCDEDNLIFKCATGYVTLNVNLPDFDLGGDLINICSDEVSILSVPENFEALWSTGQSDNNIAIANSGVYRVTVTDDAGCQVTDEISLNVDPIPSVGISKSNDLNCEFSSTILAASGGEKYEWNTGQTGERISVNLPGEYFVTVSNSNGCTNTTQINVSQNVSDVSAEITGPSTVCSVNEVVVLSAFGGDSYEWSNGEQGQSIQVIGPGSYTVTATNNLSRCKVQKSFSITLTDLFANAGPDVTACPGESVVIGADIIGPDDAVFLWENGASGIVGSNTSGKIAVSPSSTQTYNLTVTGGACSKQDKVTVFVNEFDFVTTPNVTICPGGSTILTAQGAENYFWNTGQTTNEISVSPDQTTTYSITGSGENGCETEKTITVFVAEPITSSISDDQVICPGETISISATGGSVYQWSNGAVGSAISVSPNVSTNYSVTITNNQGCRTVESVNVNIEQILNVNLEDDQVVCRNTITDLFAPPADSYLWSTGETSQLIQVSPNSTQTYSVTITQGNCTASDETILEVRDCSGDISGFTLTDQGEPIVDINVFLLNESGGLVDFKASSSSGYYQFTSIPSGKYRLQQSDLAGYINFSDEDETPDDDNDVDGANNFINVDLKIGESDADNIFRDIRDMGNISGFAFTDTGDPIVGITISLYDKSNTFINSVITSSTGFYQFVSIPSGAYTLRQEDLPGYINISDQDETPEDSNDVDGANNIINVVLEINETDADNNFRDRIDLGTISGYTLTNTGEPIRGVTISLYDDSNTLVTTALSSVVGFYRFESIPSGSYTLTQPALPGFVDVSDQDESPDDANDVDGTNNTINVVLNSKEIDADNNFRDATDTGTISGFALTSTGEPIPNSSIFLFNLQGQLIDFIGTNQDGFYQFSSIPTGAYFLDQSPVADHTNFSDRDETPDDDNDVDGTNDRINVFLNVGEIDADNNFRDSRNSGLISGLALLDEGTDGVGDRAFTEASIFLLDVNNNLLQTTEVDNDGRYSFSNLSIGEYYIEQEAIDGYQNVYDRDLTTGNLDPDGADDPVDNRIYVNLVPDESDVGNVFLDRLAITGISGFVRLDVDADGVPDEGQANISIDLLNRFGIRQDRTTTDQNGYYEFIDIPAGEYFLSEDQDEDSDYISLYDRDESINVFDQDGYDESADNIISVVLELGEFDSDNNFVNIIPNYGQIAGFVLEDQDDDDIGDAGMGGIRITLFDTNDNLITRQQTSSNGRFIFDDIEPGDYYLVETDIVGYEDVSDFDTDSDDPNDVDGTNDIIIVTIGPNELDDGNIFVNRRTGGAIVENCQTFKIDDFATGTGGFWLLGGDNAEVVTSGGIPGLPSVGFIDINDNDIDESFIFSRSQDFSVLNSLTVRFQFYVRGAEPNDYFIFEVSKNGGSSFKEINRWTGEIDFDNDSWNLGIVSILAEDLSETTVLRIRSELNSPNEHLYLDEIEIEGCFDENEDNGSGTAFTSGTDGSSTIDIKEKQNSSHTIDFNYQDTTIEIEDENSLQSSHIFPNPAIDEIHINLADVNVEENVAIEIFAMDGRMVLQTESQQKSRIAIDISRLEAEKVYIIYLQRHDKLPEMFRFLKIN